MTFKLGLTGSIGMGKSTTAKLLAEAGCEIWDADAAVHRLYSTGGRAVAPMQAAFPQAVENGQVSRERLKNIISADPTALKTIEAIVHPLLAQDRIDFVANATADILVFDVPLMFETGGDKRMDAVIVVSVPAETQRKRVMERGTMTTEQFETIRSKQMPDAEKRKRADYVLVTDTFEHAQAQVKDILADIRGKMTHA
ncbi:dephospho-CoA kinase [Thalassovita taeanensis]|uniref:Dephospho-CoA kinase n=1 Tax=Thalassovita taeanensis TaxID=657014 RepID=A0A1H9JJ92_9RHOB|nr:dephospho-CoA kinase [Thalassovita taeanensis]SEQ86869.1 dephospho-CoA kinase [Thalassovita taeanensis]